MESTHTADSACIAVFSLLSASISHELKNHLAIINESSGLLGDLTAMAAKGRPLEPERMEKILARIARGVGNADTVVKQMNRFAHSADTPVAQADLAETVGLIASLSARKAAQVRVRIEVAIAEAISIRMRLLYFEALVFLLLLSLASQNQGSTIIIEARRGETGLQLSFSISDTSAAPSLAVEDPQVEVLLAALGATLEARQQGVLLALPVEAA